MTQSPLNMDDLMEKIRAEARSRQPEVPEIVQHDAAGTVTLPRPLPSKVGEFSGQSPFHYTDFTGYDGEIFIEAVFKGLLGRKPDENALSNYLGYLQRGGSKLSMLAEVRLSEEGLQRPVALMGMSFILRRHKILKKLGLIGRVLRRVCDLFDRGVLIKKVNPIGLPDLRALDQDQKHYQTTLITHLESQFQRQNQAQQALRSELGELKRAQHTQAVQLASRIDQLHELISGQVQADMAKLNATLDKVDEVMATKASQEELEASTQLLKQQFSYLQRAFELSLEGLKSFGESAPEDLAQVAETQQESLLDAYYVAFEDACRGTRREIKQGLQHYLPRFADLQQQHSLAALPVVDVGCGRGEWLELLREQGWQGQGIDLNPVMVEVCQEFGLTAKRQDALAYLRGLPDASVAAITGFHIIEHLPFNVLHSLFSEAMRVVKGGGLILFETPNPENVLVGSHTFYHDFTHRNPVTPSAIRFMAQYFGFAEIEIIRSHPYPEEAKVPGDDPLTARVNGHLCGPQDYAILARKPLIDSSGRTLKR